MELGLELLLLRFWFMGFGAAVGGKGSGHEELGLESTQMVVDLL